MKNKISILAILFVTLMFVGCKKDDTENVSRVTYPTYFTVNGSPFISSPLGQPVEISPDLVEVKTKDGSSFTKRVTGAVNINEVGTYELLYEGTNSDGVVKQLSLYVGIYDPEAAKNNFEGTWARTANGIEVTIKKVSPCLYVIDNIGGVDPVTNPAWSFPVYFYNLEGGNLIFPEQPNPLGGTITCEDATYSNSKLSWVVIGSGFGTAPRTFVKK